VTSPAPVAGSGPDLRAARRRLLLDTAGIAVSAIGFGFVFGLAARNAGYSAVEAGAMSVIGFAGAAQFAAVGYVSAGLPWAPIVVLTFFLNARHLLYSASLAPRLRSVPFLQRAAMAHVLTDEAFALAATHFHRLGRVDVPGYWIGAILGVFIPWNLATLAGVLLGGAIPDPSRFGLDVVFPAAMAGLAVGLTTGRREVVAAGAGAAIGIVLSLAIGPALGIVAGGLLGPLVAMAMPGAADRAGGSPLSPDSDVTGVPVDLDAALAEVDAL
jgi:4-azaleucine resistance transporter AzlC